MTDPTLCRIPIVGCMTKNATTGEWEINKKMSVWADIPADLIARKLIDSFGLESIKKGSDTDC